MLKTEKKVIYKAFGLRIVSEIPLPELSQQLHGYEESIDIIIELDNRPRIWNLFLLQNQKFDFTENSVIFHVPDIAIFTIRDGNKITVSPSSGCDEEIIRIYILGTCMGVILMQRRIYPLHGSAVAIDGKAYAFVGDSGAGKSTLASTFLNQGFQLVSDDVIAVSFSESDYSIVVTPAYPQQKLWEESLNEFGMNTGRYRSIYGRESKYCVPVSSQYYAEPLPLAGIFELIKSDDEQVGIQPIQGLDRLHTLYCHTYRNFLISRLDLLEWHFKTSAAVANQIDVYRIRRPMLGFTATQLATLIMSTINKEE